MGGVILGGDTVAQFKNQVCDRVTDGKKGSEKGNDQLFMSDSYMCSTKCPCPEKDVKDKYSALFKADKKRFDASARYIDNGGVAPAGKSKLVFATSGTTYATF